MNTETWRTTETTVGTWTTAKIVLGASQRMKTSDGNIATSTYAVRIVCNSFKGTCARSGECLFTKIL